MVTDFFVIWRPISGHHKCRQVGEQKVPRDLPKSYKIVKKDILSTSSLQCVIIVRFYVILEGQNRAKV